MTPSPAVAVKAGADELVAAFQSDLMALDLDRRLSQLELEHLLFRRWRLDDDADEQTTSVAELEAQLDALFKAHAITAPTAHDVSQAMSQTDKAGAVIGPLMDQLAFDTNIDLDQLRALLLDIWNARTADKHRADQPHGEPIAEVPEQATPGQTDLAEGLGAALARRIEEGRAKNEDMESVFKDVAELLGEDIDEELVDDDSPTEVEADEDADKVVPFDGDLEPLIQEFMWETECGGGHEEEVLGRLLAQQRDAPVPNLQLEFLTSTDLLRMVLRVYLESRPDQRLELVQREFAVLDEFCRWAQATQEFPLIDQAELCRAEFVDEVERLQRGSTSLSSRTTPDTPRPRLLRVLEVGATSLEVVPVDGTEAAIVPASITAGDVREGDLLMAALETGADGSTRLAGLVQVLPAVTESLLG